MKYIILAIKGFIIGIANIIPGVSGGTAAIMLGIYEELIHRVSHLFEDLIDNIKYILPIAVGVLLSVVIMSNVIDYSFNNFPLPTMMFFVGLVLGGIPMLLKNVKGKKETKEASSYLIFIVTFFMVVLLSLSELLFKTGFVDLSSMTMGGYLALFLIGAIAACAMVIPGISGSLVLLLLGYYNTIITTIKDLVHFNNIGHNLVIMIIFGLGVLVGIVVISKILELLFKRHPVKTYFGVLGFVSASFFAIPISTILKYGDLGMNIPLAVVGLITMIFGSIISFKLGDK
jgi:putative membrane protein